MSNAALKAVFERSKAKGNARCVLLSIADRANEKGVTWCGAADLMRRANCGRDTVFDSLRKLRQLEEIVVEEETGPRRCNVYRLTPKLLSTREENPTTKRALTREEKPTIGNSDRRDFPAHQSEKPDADSGEIPTTTREEIPTQTLLNPPEPKKNPLSSADGDDEKVLALVEREGIEPENARAILDHWKAGKITSSIRAFARACKKSGEYPEPVPKPKRFRPIPPRIDRLRLAVMRMEPQFKAWILAGWGEGFENSPQKVPPDIIEKFCEKHGIEPEAISVPPTDYDPERDNACAPSRRGRRIDEARRSYEQTGIVSTAGLNLKSF